MEVSITKDGKMVITIEANNLQNLPLSPTGKTRQIASSHGNRPTACIVNGQPVVVGLNAYIKA